MPLYDYQCQACGVYHEVYALMNDRKDEIECPRCKGVAEQVIIGAPGILTSNMSNKTQDVAIGTDADKRWQRIFDRKAERDKVRKESGKKGIRATPQGEFGAKDYKGVNATPQFVPTPKSTERVD